MGGLSKPSAAPCLKDLILPHIFSVGFVEQPDKSLIVENLLKALLYLVACQKPSLKCGEESALK